MTISSSDLPGVEIILKLDDPPERGSIRIGCQVADGVQLELGNFILHEVGKTLGAIGTDVILVTDLREAQSKVDEQVRHLLLGLMSSGYLKSSPVYGPYSIEDAPVKWYFNSPYTDKPFEHLRDAPSATGRPAYAHPSTYISESEMPPLHSSCRCITRELPEMPSITKEAMVEAMKALSGAGKSASKAGEAFSTAAEKAFRGMSIIDMDGAPRDEILYTHTGEWDDRNGEEDDEWELDDGAYDGLEYEDDSEEGSGQ